MAFPPSNRASVPESAYLDASGDPSKITLPPYLSETVLANRARANIPLIRLSIFDDIKALAIQSRQLIFAVQASKVKSSRITLLSDDRNLDHLIALHMQGRDLTGDFGVRDDNSPALTKEVLQDSRVVAAKQAAAARLADVEEKWKAEVLGPLEAQYESWKAASSGGGFFRRKSSSADAGDKKVDYMALSDKAGPLLRECKSVHEEVEARLMEVISGWANTKEPEVEQLPLYEKNQGVMA